MLCCRVDNIVLLQHRLLERGATVPKWLLLEKLHGMNCLLGESLYIPQTLQESN